MESSSDQMSTPINTIKCANILTESVGDTLHSKNSCMFKTCRHQDKIRYPRRSEMSIFP
jgi:hypothetical protein